MIFPTAFLVLLSSIMSEISASTIPAPDGPNVFPPPDGPNVFPPPITKKYILNFSALKPTSSSGQINIQYAFGNFVSSPVLVRKLQTAGILDQNQLIGSETLVTVRWKFESSNFWRTFQFNAICDNLKHSENIWGAVRALPIFFDYKCYDSLLSRPSSPIITLPVIRPVNPIAAAKT
jgi:hypothetical protein